MSVMKVCSDLDKLHPYCLQQAKKVLADCASEGLKVEIFETIRTTERQKWLVSNGKSKTMESYHRLGLAVDFVFKTEQGAWTWRVADAKWNRLAEIMEKHGFYSLWKRHGWDGPHGEIRFKGIKTRDLYRQLEKCKTMAEFFTHVDKLIAADAAHKAIAAAKPAPEKMVVVETKEGVKLPEPEVLETKTSEVSGSFSASASGTFEPAPTAPQAPKKTGVAKVAEAFKNLFKRG